MKLQDQMFGLITEWYSGKLFKKDFLADKTISQGKFDYWLKKYHSAKSGSTDPTQISKTENFKEIVLPAVKLDEPKRKRAKPIKIIELRTRSGLQIKIFEKC